MRTTAGLKNLLLAIGLAVPVATGAWASEARGTSWLGVYSQEITPELREGLDYNGSGVLIRRVVSDSPAQRAGIQRGDVIVRVGSREVRDPDGLASVVRNLGAGRTIEIEIVRDGRVRTMTATLEERPSSEEPEDRVRATPPRPPVPPGDLSVPPPPLPGRDRDEMRDRKHEDKELEKDLKDRDSDEDDDSDRDNDGDRSDLFEFDAPGPDMMPDPGMLSIGRGRLGVRVESLNPDLASYFGSREAKGVLVLDVTDESAADRAGIRPGDVITKVESDATTERIDDADDLIRTIQNSEGEVTITLIRHGSVETVQAKLGPKTNIMRLRRGPGFDMQRGRNGERQRVWTWSDRDSKDSDRKRITIDGDEKTNAELRRELEELREELRQMREELRNK